MNIKNHIIGLGGAILLASLTIPNIINHAKADTVAERITAINARREAASDHWVVVLSGRERLEWNEAGYYEPVDYEIDVVSSSRTAPKFQKGDDLAESLAKLRAAGAEITIHATAYLQYTATR